VGKIHAFLYLKPLLLRLVEVKTCNWYEMIRKLKLTHFFECFRLDSCIYVLFVIIMWIFVFLNDHVDIPSPSKIMLMIEPRIIIKTRWTCSLLLMNTYFYDVHFSIQTLSYTLVKYRVVIKISDSIKHAYLNIYGLHLELIWTQHMWEQV
jgi:hypothetical protein